MHGGSVCGTIRADGRRKVHHHHVARLDVVIAVEGHGQRAAVCIIDIAQTVIRIHHLIRPSVDFLVHIAVKVRGVSLNSLSNVSRHREVAFRGILRCGIQLRGKRS